MKQWWMVPGPDGAVAELRDVDLPEPAADQVLVRMIGAGVNRGELIGGRALRIDNPRASPTRSGIELAGTIEAIGTSVTDWSPGDRVMARSTACHAEFAVVDTAALMPSPASLTDLEAAAIPNVFVTAHDALMTAAAAGPDDTVLITAGASGVGTAAIQIAHHLGAHVVTTTRSPAKASTLRDLGADLVIDTRDDAWPDVMRNGAAPPSVVIDLVGGELFDQLLRSMAVRGRYVSVGRNAGPTSTIDLDLLARQRLHLIGVTFRSRTRAESLECSRRFAADLLPLFDGGQLRPVVARSFPLDDLPAAHHYMRSDAQLGKIVLTNDPAGAVEPGSST